MRSSCVATILRLYGRLPQLVLSKGHFSLQLRVLRSLIEPPSFVLLGTSALKGLSNQSHLRSIQQVHIGKSFSRVLPFRRVPKLSSAAPASKKEVYVASVATNAPLWRCILLDSRSTFKPRPGCYAADRPLHSPPASIYGMPQTPFNLFPIRLAVPLVRLSLLTKSDEGEHPTFSPPPGPQ